MPRPLEKNQKDVERFLTTVAVRGYKSLAEECSVDIRPLTILAGANSSGKSSVMQPILLLKQTLEASYDPGTLLLNGPNIRLTSVDQCLSKVGRIARTDTCMIRLEIEEGQSLTSIFKRRKELELVEMTYQDREVSITLRPDMLHEELQLAVSQSLAKFPFLSETEDGLWRLGISRKRCFLELEMSFMQDMDDSSRMPIMVLWPGELFTSRVRTVIHVPGLRGNPERTYPITAVVSEFPGTFDHYVASVIHHWQVTHDRRLAELEAALQLLGLTRKIDAKYINDAQVELRVSQLPHNARGRTGDMVSIADVGFGVSQALPVLVALLAAEPGQLVYLEQPELHLHPRAQSAMAQILADAANRGVRVVAETHSELILLTVQSLVAEGYLAPDKVKLHWFTRRHDGVTQIQSADVDETGAFGDWPEDFAEVILTAESRYLDAVELRRQGQ